MPEAGNSTDFLCFRVVIGPSGCGKTSTVRELCNKFTKGVIYYEVDELSRFVWGLSKKLNMKTSPTNFMDLMLGYISKNYTHFHVLPEDQLAGIKVVFDAVEKEASRYKRKYGQIPTLFIDGVDLLAKDDKKLCCRLITLAKILANNKKLKVVLVSSEGTIMPLLEMLSAANRALVYEVEDIDDEKAEIYLIENGIEEDTAKKLVNLIGGRLVYLQSTIKIIQNTTDGKDIMESIKTKLFSRTLSSQKAFLKKTKKKVM